MVHHSGPDANTVTSYNIQVMILEVLITIQSLQMVTYTKGSFSYKQLPNLVTLNINGNYYLSDGVHS